MSYKNDLLWLITDVGRMIRVEADRRARVHGMSRAQWAMLARLDREPGQSQKELADAMDVEPITVARLADRLEAHGLLERRPDPSDRRIWRLHLLEGAASVLDELSVQRAEMFRLATASLDPDTVGAVEEALVRIQASMSRRAAVPEEVTC